MVQGKSKHKLRLHADFASFRADQSGSTETDSRVDGDTPRYEARTAVGDLYDAFDLRKRPGRPNQLIEKIPDTPERHRPASVTADTKGVDPATSSCQVK